MGVGWRHCSISTGRSFIRMLSQALWYLDPHHTKFQGQGMHIPDRFCSFTRYNDFKWKREKEPHLSAEGLHQHIEQFSIILMQPWLSAKRFDVICGDVEQL